MYLSKDRERQVGQVKRVEPSPAFPLLICCRVVPGGWLGHAGSLVQASNVGCNLLVGTAWSRVDFIPRAHFKHWVWCVAVDSLCNSNAIDTLLSNFIVPLQGDEISTTEDGKVRSHPHISCPHVARGM